MEKKFIDNNKKSFIFLIALFIIFSLLSFFIIINYFTKLEKNINDTSISNLVHKIQSKIDYNHKISLEYSSSDEVYEFIQKNNQDYIYKNFREGSYTLEDLDLSYFILSDKENKIRYSNFTKDIQKEEASKFSTFILNKFKNINKINQIIIYKNEAYYISKSPIYKTDYENSSNGFLYLGSKVNTKNIEKLSQGFTKITFIGSSLVNVKKINQSNKLSIILKTKVKSKKINNLNTSEISFYDYNSNILFSVKVEKDINLVNKIRNNVLIIFICLVFLAILLILYLVNKYRNALKEKQESVDKIIENKTSEMKLQIQELEKSNENLYEIAHTDYLTQTMNRRNFFIHAQSNFSDAKKKDELLCVVMIDIDNFKNFNDKYGHSIGDKVLVLFANSIKNNITEKTILGRIGGEEFALIIKNTKLEDAIKKAEKLKQKIEEIELEVDGKILNITASFGVSDNQNCANIDEMLQRADNLLYTAKESGRNLVRSRLNFC